MSEDCAAMPPTTTDRESSKSPSGSHSIDDILGIKVAAGSAQLVSSEQQQQQPQGMYNGSDSSSDSSSNSDDRESSPSLAAGMEHSRSPPPLQQLPTTQQQQPQQLLQMTALQGTAAAAQGTHGKTLFKAMLASAAIIHLPFLQNSKFYKWHLKVSMHFN